MASSDREHIGEEEIDFICNGCEKENSVDVEFNKGNIEISCHHCEALNSFDYEIEYVKPNIFIENHKCKPKEEVDSEIENLLQTPPDFNEGTALVSEHFYDAWDKLEDSEKEKFIGPYLNDCEREVVLAYLYFQHRDEVEFITEVYNIDYQGNRESELNVGMKSGEILEFRQSWNRGSNQYNIFKTSAISKTKSRKEILERTADSEKLLQFGIEISEGKRVPDKEYYDLLRKVS